MSKTFNSITTPGLTLDISRGLYGTIYFKIRDGVSVPLDISLHALDSAAVALAVLESTDLEDYYYVEARNNLRLREEEYSTKRAELETKASDLYLEYCSAVDVPFQEWDDLSEQSKRQWIAVARRSEELESL